MTFYSTTRHPEFVPNSRTPRSNLGCQIYRANFRCQLSFRSGQLSLTVELNATNRCTAVTVGLRGVPGTVLYRNPLPGKNKRSNISLRTKTGERGDTTEVPYHLAYCLSSTTSHFFGLPPRTANKALFS